MTTQKTAGKQSLTFEPPDLFVYRLRGTIELWEVSDLLALNRALIEGKSYFLVLCDVRELERVSPHVRRAVMSWTQSSASRAVAFYGTSAAVRILLEMVMRALVIIVPRPNRQVRFFPDEEGARAWLYELRMQWQQALCGDR